MTENKSYSKCSSLFPNDHDLCICPGNSVNLRCEDPWMSGICNLLTVQPSPAHQLPGWPWCFALSLYWSVFCPLYFPCPLCLSFHFRSLLLRSLSFVCQVILKIDGVRKKNPHLFSHRTQPCLNCFVSCLQPLLLLSGRAEHNLRPPRRDVRTTTQRKECLYHSVHS